MLNRFSLLLFVLPLLAEAPFPQFHDATYKAGWDLHFSPYAGGENILFVHRSIERFEGYALTKTSIPFSKKASSRFWRLTELYLGWLPVNYFAAVAQHEVFGHGYRIRDIHRNKAIVTGYHFQAPPPYGNGGGSTNYKVSNQLTTTEESAIAIGGVESTAILAELTRLKWLEANFVDPRQSVLYLVSEYDLSLYIGSLDVKNDETLDGHDISSYVRTLNYTYTSCFLNKSKLKSLAWINFADPFTYYSIYAWFRYIASGKETQIPMIPIYSYGYLPNLRLGLTPFGPEIFFENHLLKGKNPIYFYLKGGEHSKNRYTGAGTYVPHLFSTGKWHFGVRLDVWRQPKLLLSPGNTPFLEIDFEEKPNANNPLYPYSEQHAMRVGAAGSVLIAYQNRSGFEAELGYKSQGFLPGYSLRASPTARLYYSLLF
jgi:hypothetical protein